MFNKDWVCIVGKEIKFRGKKIGSDEYVYGFYAKVAFPARKGLEWRSYILTGSSKVVQQIRVLERIQVLGSTVGQYTGQKNEQGEDIYELLNL